MLIRRRRASPLVSVIAICYNHERFARECLDSIAAQTYPNVEIIAVDDCSRDSSRQLIEAWIIETGREVTFIAHEENRGICRSRNEAIGLARGAYLACISTDDIWLPEKIAIQVAEMNELPERVAVLYADAYLMDEAGAALPGMFIEQQRTFAVPPQGVVFEELLTGNFIPSLATLVRRECVASVGGYDESLAFEDWDMWLRLSRSYEFAYSTHPAARYRIVSKSLIRVLHGERRSEFLDSCVRLISKHVGVGAREDHLIGTRMRELANALGLLDHPAYMALAARIEHNIGTGDA